jgi:hypothetical protein
MKTENAKTRAHSAGPHCGPRLWPASSARWLMRPIQPARSDVARARPSWSLRLRVLQAMRWCDRHDLAGGLDVAVVAASSSLEHRGCAGQDEVERGSPVRSSDGKAAAGGGAEEVISIGWGSSDRRRLREAPTDGGRGGVHVWSLD